MGRILIPAAFALAAGLTAIGQVPALAAPAASPTVSIRANSNNPKITGDVNVTYQAGKNSIARISGTVTGARTGEVVRIFGQRFPFRAEPAQAGKPQVLRPSGTTAGYLFRVQPYLATRYRVEVFANDTATTPLARSSVVTVYVLARGTASFAPRTCARPTCNLTVHIIMTVPPSTLGIEYSQRWYGYFGLRLGSRAIPAPPKWLYLGGGHARFGKTSRISRSQYAVNLFLSFSIGNHSYRWQAAMCQRDIEATDGLNLPGRHGCGLKVIRSNYGYLG